MTVKVYRPKGHAGAACKITNEKDPQEAMDAARNQVNDQTYKIDRKNYGMNVPVMFIFVKCTSRYEVRISRTLYSNVDTVVFDGCKLKVDMFMGARWKEGKQLPINVYAFNSDIELYSSGDYVHVYPIHSHVKADGNVIVDDYLSHALRQYVRPKTLSLGDYPEPVKPYILDSALPIILTLTKYPTIFRGKLGLVMEGHKQWATL